MKDTELLLPLGSVVRLKNGKALMIIQGFVPNDLSKKDTYYDYEGNLFVTGRQGETVYMFNQEDIDEVLFIGYQTKQLSFLRPCLFQSFARIIRNYPYKDSEFCSYSMLFVWRH